MNNRCPHCHLVNFPHISNCGRCGAEISTHTLLENTAEPRKKAGFLTRAAVCAGVCLAMLLGFYVSLITSAKKLTTDEKAAVRRAVAVIEETGFNKEAMLLNTITAFRGTDNWLNASVAKENAYAATNFPFEVMTLYPDFFTYPADDVERAAVLLHESKHLAGKNEHDAYEFVWKNRKQLGWTKERYADSPVWSNVRRQTLENVPELFVCEKNDFQDCTQ